MYGLWLLKYIQYKNSAQNLAVGYLDSFCNFNQLRPESTKVGYMDYCTQLLRSHSGKA